MSRRYKNPWTELRDFNVKDLIRLELELVLTFGNLAHTKYSMGNIRGGDVSRANAEKAYRTALKYFAKLADVTSLERRTFKGLIKKAKDAIATLPKASTHQ
jgi:hypothetical protein